MIKEIKGIDNFYMFNSYNSMVDSMYEETVDISKGFSKNIKDKAKRISLVDNKTFNFFGMYSKEIYSLYREVCSAAKDLFLENNINFERSYPYLYARVMDNNQIPPYVDLNFGPNFKTVFFGFYVVSSNNEFILINDNKTNLVPGNLILLDHNTRVQFNNISKDLVLIELHISPLEYLHKQYYQKWIPLV
jgi:hypothetical protein